MVNENGEPSGILFGAINSLRKCISDIAPEKVIFVWDGLNGSARRKAIFSGYKAGRGMKRMTNFSCFKDKNEEYKSLLYQSGKFKKYLDILPVSQIHVEGLEADDIVGFLATRGKKENEEIVIMSTDKDFLQLLNPTVKMYNPIKNMIINEVIMKKNYSDNVPPQNFVLMRTVLGDTSDNLSGVKGIGPKTMLKLFPELLNEKKLSVWDLLSISETKVLEEENKLTKWYKRIIENFDIIERNYRLMVLDELNMISISQLKEIQSVIDEKWKLFQMTQLSMMFREDKLWKHVNNISRFTSVFLRLHGKSMRENKLMAKNNY